MKKMLFDIDVMIKDLVNLNDLFVDLQAKEMKKSNVDFNKLTTMQNLRIQNIGTLTSLNAYTGDFIVEVKDKK